MTGNLEKQAELVFYAALERGPAVREAYLKEACGGDAALRGRVGALLEAYDADESLHDTGPDNPPDGEAPGSVIGPYKLLEKIGEGGFGVVWAAEQKEPVKRRVALKIIKLGMDTKEVVARFEAERQALALMDHPNIAKVLDAGATATGRPYFVMELVRGIPIIEYCDRAQLSVRDRLDLFVKVCNAIQHAHQKGIIHRDIKPSNILITLHDGVPVPRIIDFGIAKATQQELTEMTVYTQLNQFLGTPAYMSPEQAEMSGLDLDTRSDIYSLGVLLYELLTGTTPFEERDLLQSGIDAMRKIIREQEPPKPSTRFSTLQIEEQSTTALRHATDSPRLISLLRGDLDWIVMKCLEKDRTRRYETASGLASDVARYLSHEPVTARPPTVFYRLQKAWRRNKVVYTAVVSVAIALVVGTGISVWQAWNANVARDQAVRDERHARESEVEALRRAYNSDMSLAFHALEENLIGRVQETVRRQVPTPGQPDLRGWEWRYAWAQSQSDADYVWDTPADMGEVAAVRISPDGRYLVSSDFHYNSTFYHHARRLWDLETRQERADVRLPGGSEYGFSFSNSGKYLALGRDRNELHGGEQVAPEIRVYETADWNLIGVIPSESRIPALCFSPDDTMLAAAEQRRVVLWDWRARKIVHTWPIKGRKAWLTAVAFFPNGRYLALGGTDGLKIVDASTGEVHHRQAARDGIVTTLAVSADSRYVAFGSERGRCDIGLLDTLSWEQEPPLVGHSRSVTSLTFSATGRRLISSSADHTIRVWDMDSRSTARVLKGHHSGVGSVTFLSDESRAVSGGYDKRICEWDLNAPLPAYRPHILTDEDIRQVVFAADSGSFYTVDGGGSVSVWDAQTFSKRQSASENLGKDSSINLSPDGDHLIAGTGSGHLWIFAAEDLQTTAHRPTQAGRIIPVGFSADGRSLVLLEAPHTISSWDTETWQRRSSARTRLPIKLIGMNSNIYAIPPGSDMLLYPSGADLVWWDLRSAQERANIPVNSHFPGWIAVSPTEPLLASVDRGEFLRLWNWQTQQPDRWLRGPSALFGVAFSPDGRRLIAGSPNLGSLVLWDVATRQEIAQFGTGLSAGIDAVQFAPDGNTICAVDASGTAHFWRAPSFREISAVETRPQRQEAAL